jgi:hypothetical protein
MLFILEYSHFALKLYPKNKLQSPKFSGIAAFCILENKSSYENGCPSPDGRENPCLPGFGKQDWNDSRK